jgi:FkbH-like protein
LLAVSSKNNEADAREPFERHPEMRIRLDDVAAFVANWEHKADGIRAVARQLNIGLDAIAFVDDNPVERQAIRQLLPEVDVIRLPADPALYVRALADYLGFETSALTAEDARRTDQYRARARIVAAESAATSIEEFYRSLRMQALVAPFDEIQLPRIAQLVGKTNQFNLTTRRHGLAELRGYMHDPRCVHLALRLRDQFTDHGLVGVLIAVGAGDTLEIDSWLMSCRVLGRTADAEMLAHLSRRAAELGYAALGGTYVPTAKNALVRDVFATFGFEPVGGEDGITRWRYDLRARGPICNEFIETVDSWGGERDASSAA